MKTDNSDLGDLIKSKADINPEDIDDIYYSVDEGQIVIMLKRNRNDTGGIHQKIKREKREIKNMRTRTESLAEEQHESCLKESRIEDAKTCREAMCTLQKAASEIYTSLMALEGTNASTNSTTKTDILESMVNNDKK